LLPLSAIAVGAAACRSELTTDIDGSDTTAGTDVGTTADTEPTPDSGILGEWKATSLTDFSGHSFAMPHSYTDTREETSTTTTWSLSMTASTRSVVVTGTRDCSTVDNGVMEASGETDTCAGCLSDTSAPVHVISFEDDSPNMGCSLARDILICVSTTTDPQCLRMAFDRDRLVALCKRYVGALYRSPSRT
jgi:hypothetical protein